MCNIEYNVTHLIKKIQEVVWNTHMIIMKVTKIW